MVEQEQEQEIENKNDYPEELIINKNIIVEKMYEIFPKNENIDKIRITDVGLYSITKKNEAYFITNLITKFFNNTKVIITDSTACIGGNTISFQLHDQITKVYSIEINKLHHEILRNNVLLYKNNDKVKIINDNYLNIMKNIEQDIIFHDFPWCGINYKENDQINIGLYDDNNNFIKLSNIVNELKTHARMQVIKLPLNFEFVDFFQEIKFNKIKIHKIYNKYTKKLYYYILILIN